MSTDLTFTDKLRRIRENFRHSEAEMAEQLNSYGLSEPLDADAIREFEAGLWLPSGECLSAYSSYSGIPIRSLVDDEIQPFA